MKKEERYAIWNRYYQKHKTEINARRKIVRESYKNKLSEAENKIAELEKEKEQLTISYETLKLHDEEEIGMLKSENAELKSRECWKSCEYANPKSELIAQHIKDVQQLTNAKEIIKKFLLWENDWHNKTESKYELLKEAEQFLKE